MESPTSAILELWNRCNLRCSFCYLDSERNRDNFFKSIDVLKNEVDKIEKTVKAVVLLWGEPLIYEHIFELFDYLKIKQMRFCLVTSGYHLSDSNLLKKVMEYDNMEMFIISIHTIYEQPALKIYGLPWIIQHHIKGIDNLVKVAQETWRNDLPLVNNMVLNKYNVDHIDKVIQHLFDRGISLFQISTMHIYTNWFSKRNYDSLVPYIYMLKSLRRIKKLINTQVWLFRIKSMPLCIHRFFMEFNYIIKEFVYDERTRIDSWWEIDVWDNQKPMREKIKKCEWCYAYGKECFWPYKYYLNKFWDKEFKTLSKDEYLKLYQKSYNEQNKH